MKTQLDSVEVARELLMRLAGDDDAHDQRNYILEAIHQTPLDSLMVNLNHQLDHTNSPRHPVGVICTFLDLASSIPTEPPPSPFDQYCRRLPQLVGKLVAGEHHRRSEEVSPHAFESALANFLSSPNHPTFAQRHRCLVQLTQSVLWHWSNKPENQGRPLQPPRIFVSPDDELRGASQFFRAFVIALRSVLDPHLSHEWWLRSVTEH